MGDAIKLKVSEFCCTFEDFLMYIKYGISMHI
jgi:hypothetical protein